MLPSSTTSLTNGNHQTTTEQQHLSDDGIIGSGGIMDDSGSNYIKSSEQKNYIANVDLYDNLGQIVKTTLFRQDLSLIKLNFVTNPGIYYLKVKFSNGDLKTKIILVN